MRSIWKGAVSFGLVSISVKLYSATEEKDIRFHQVHREDGGRIRYKRTCSVCGREVTYDDIAKGYDLGGGELVILTDEDFTDLPLSTSRAIDVLEFVPAEQVDPILYAKSYYLEPDGSAIKPYVLLRDALTRTDRVAIVKVALRQREQLATLRVRDDVLVLNTMLWPDEVRRPEFEFLDDDVQARPAELAMAGSLIESMAADFDPDQYTDNYRVALQEVIDAKVAGREVVAPEEEEPAPSGAIDLMAALRASVERARSARGETGAGAGEPTPISSARSATKKAAPAKKAPPAGKTAAKKAAPAKQAAAKKAEPAKKAELAKKAEPAAKKTAAKKTTRAKKTA
ncbi:Ku protein [Planosporangium thailandense]|uniref:Non-homologous end joining protein Ku n=1 Tax=Planosporangium thailandense TaxID=765197 RepID=A0ABX0XTD3_9ACTN|nr:Ku protein [Planosporangium thailandense]NJC69255.1 Ku protein [Planosporangium thailandense]